MFRVIASTLLGAAFTGIAYRFLFILKREAGKNPIDFQLLLSIFLISKSGSQSLSHIQKIRRYFYLFTLLSFALLAITGWFPLLVFNHTLSGYALLFHASVSPIFAFCLLMWALMSVSFHTFVKRDWDWVKNRGWRSTETDDTLKHGYSVGRKVCFWSIILPAFPVIVTIVLSMVSLFGTSEQMLLIRIHRYCALWLSFAMILHAYFSFLTFEADNPNKIHEQ
jgi:cytochrome b subunit of formate dehydrogenase